MTGAGMRFLHAESELVAETAIEYVTEHRPERFGIWLLPDRTTKRAAARAMTVSEMEQTFYEIFNRDGNARGQFLEALHNEFPAKDTTVLASDVDSSVVSVEMKGTPTYLAILEPGGTFSMVYMQTLLMRET